ncbi:hypothetical protein BLOT_014142 [Blomia tropicalis]|nr:hypothetical protein BLOT_014142 [Blomia tropicalis]
MKNLPFLNGNFMLSANPNQRPLTVGRLNISWLEQIRFDCNSLMGDRSNSTLNLNTNRGTSLPRDNDNLEEKCSIEIYIIIYKCGGVGSGRNRYFINSICSDRKLYSQFGFDS